MFTGRNADEQGILAPISNVQDLRHRQVVEIDGIDLHNSKKPMLRERVGLDWDCIRCGPRWNLVKGSPFFLYPQDRKPQVTRPSDTPGDTPGDKRVILVGSQGILRLKDKRHA